MKRIFTSRVVILLIAAVAAALLIGVSLNLSGGHSAGQNVTETLLQPVRSGVASITRQMEQVYNYIYRYEALEAENRALKEQIAAMEEQSSKAAEYQRENERLRELLNLRSDYEEYTIVPAYITGWDSSVYRSGFQIGKGENSGIEVGMCAVTEYGDVIGLVTAVGANWATVTTVLDANLQISAQVTGSGYTGVAKGTLQTGESGDVRVDYIDADAVLKNGDLVVTAGSNYFPKGLTLGRITGFGSSPGGTSHYAEVRSGADFSSLEQVFVITEYEVE